MIVFFPQNLNPIFSTSPFRHYEHPKTSLRITTMSQTFQQYHFPEKKGFGYLTLRNVPREAPKFGKILVRLKAVSLNWRDGILAMGTYPLPGPDALVPGSNGTGMLYSAHVSKITLYSDI